MRKLFRLLFSMAKLGCLLVVIGVIGVLVLQRLQPSGGGGGGWQPPPPGANPAPVPPQPGSRPVVDLAIVGARGTWRQGQRYFEVTAQNQGPGVASVVHADCSYRCASTGSSADSVALFRNANLGPGQPFAQILPVMPCPDTSFHLSCIVYAGTPVQEANLNNNHWAGVIQF